MHIIRTIIVIILNLSVVTIAYASPEYCSYSTYKWNTQLRKAVEYKLIEKPYSNLQSFEVDADTACSVCEQDQVAIKLNNGISFKMCHVFASDVESVLNALVESGQAIEKVIGYRVGMTRGEIDEQGNRTGFSNHSFGIAIDINPDQNGLYDYCLEYGPECRLIKGGPWVPGNDQRSLTLNGMIVTSLKKLGFRWGGEISGKQKDFMHFSITGY